MGLLDSVIGVPGLGKAIQGVGGSIANVGNASSGVIPQAQSGAQPKSVGGGSLPTQGPIAGQPAAPTPISSLPGVPAPQVGTTATPGAGGMIPSQSLPAAPPINGQDFNSVYGVDTGSAITNLLNSESGGAASTTAQQIIQANAPNTAKGSADLNEGLAAAGISPSSSVSAITNANYMGQVDQQNLSEEAKIGLQEQSQQQQLLEDLLPAQQQRQTDSSGWSIFGDIMEGIGDIL